MTAAFTKSAVEQAALAWLESIGCFSGPGYTLRTAGQPSSDQPDPELALSRGLTWREVGRRRVAREVAA